MYKNSLLLLFCISIFSFKTDLKTTTRLKQKSKDAVTFCKSNGYNTDFCILIDMNIHSGKKRAFLWDMKKDSILASGMCAHGCGNNPWGETYTKEKPKFSNTPDSHCTSIGKFKVGKRGYSNWGINVNYLLHGLESTNSNALKRQIVLHSWDDVPENEVHPYGTPEGWGCPAVDNKFMKTLDPKLKASGKPVLLWMFD
ncbi:MAG: murein L,D-transpeptidase catalytic domain family protein [Bacteroidetes bacterium]|nr:murein L,D-transpeptidase catalytic domain family protein [Bacteroidota bacterium]